MVYESLTFYAFPEMFEMNNFAGIIFCPGKKRSSSTLLTLSVELGVIVCPSALTKITLSVTVCACVPITVKMSKLKIQSNRNFMFLIIIICLWVGNFLSNSLQHAAVVIEECHYPRFVRQYAVRQCVGSCIFAGLIKR